jgi:hypothetical protein
MCDGCQSLKYFQWWKLACHVTYSILI